MGRFKRHQKVSTKQSRNRNGAIDTENKLRVIMGGGEGSGGLDGWGKL